MVRDQKENYAKNCFSVLLPTPRHTSPSQATPSHVTPRHKTPCNTTPRNTRHTPHLSHTLRHAAQDLYRTPTRRTPRTNAVSPLETARTFYLRERTSVFPISDTLRRNFLSSTFDPGKKAGDSRRQTMDGGGQDGEGWRVRGWTDNYRKGGI